MTRPLGLTGRLVLAQLLAVLVGAVALAVVALAIGPPLFRSHVRRAVGVVSPQLSDHLQDAFLAAGSISVGIGMAAFLLAAVTASLLITRRLSRPLRALADAAARLAAGDHATRLGPTQLGPEFETLIGAFNTMADALESTEQTRRRLLGDVAHELRTPLATIEAYLEGLADGVRTLDAQTLDVLGTQTTRLHRLVEDISLVSRAEGTPTAAPSPPTARAPAPERSSASACRPRTPRLPAAGPPDARTRSLRRGLGFRQAASNVDGFFVNPRNHRCQEVYT
ncbi:HAMP domain-containing protein [Streptomyces sp. NPDC018833]|uniref:HAMP domain-containing protein n=1 Tax=Streptomyces sp. NPDC018833 TaxID=3365053 RepID=UPI00379F3597